MHDVVALGELLIDFLQNGMNSKGNPVFEANPGGFYRHNAKRCNLFHAG